MQPVNYSSVDEMYKKLFSELNNYARKNLIDKDNSIDAVHEGFIKVLEWKSKHPDGMLNPDIIYKKVQRACRRINRQNKFVSLDDPALATYFRTV
jgi:hypothetical protein